MYVIILIGFGITMHDRSRNIFEHLVFLVQIARQILNTENYILNRVTLQEPHLVIH